MKSIRKSLWTVLVAGMLLGLITCTSSDDTINPVGPEPGGDPKPFIVSLTPNAGPAGGGTSVLIRGSNLQYVKTVTFLDVPATITFQEGDALTVITGALGPIPQDVTGDVKVTNSTGGTHVVVDGWTYLSGTGVQPTVTGACPPIWPAEDPGYFIPSEWGVTVSCDFNGDGTNEGSSFRFEMVRINGTNLDFVNASVVGAGVPGVTLVFEPVQQVLVQHATFLYVDPAGYTGPKTVTGPITVTTGEGLSDTLPDSFTYMVGGITPDTPDAFSIDPNRVSQAGGVVVRILGTALAGVTHVTFINSNTVATGTDITVVSDNEIRVLVPAFLGTILGDEITGQVIVMKGAPGGVGTLVDPTPVSPFTYVRVLADASCSGIDPAGGTEGDTVTVFGEDLGDTVNAPPIAVAIPQIDGDPVTTGVSYLDTDADGMANEVIFDMPRFCASGAVLVELTDEFGRLLDACAHNFAYTAPFEILTGPEPNRGAAEGGQEIAFTGCGLNVVTGITICGNPAGGLNPDADGESITAITPPSPTGGEITCDVVVMRGGESITLKDAFTYYAGLPDGQTMVPNVGPLCGGTVFRMYGQNLIGVDVIRYAAAGNPAIGQQASVAVNLTDTELISTTPGGWHPSLIPVAPILTEVYAVDENPGGDELIDPTPILFVYSHPGLTSVQVCAVPGEEVIVTGTGFRDATTGRDLVDQVFLNGIAVPATVLSQTQLRVVIPNPFLTGDYNLTISVPNDDAGCYTSGSLPIRIFNTENDAICAGGILGCSDGIDNDRNGFTDCADPACIGLVCTDPGALCDMVTGECHEIDCTDFSDNDVDGLTNCQDPDCDMCTDAGEDCLDDAVNPGRLICIETACADGVDNNGDTFTDEADMQCCFQVFPGDPQCFAPCQNERDDNGNGMADDNDTSSNCAALGLLGCRDGIDNNFNGVWDEGEPACFGAAACADGIDNDGNGTFDEGEEGCFGPLSCVDAVDNNLDGFTDEQDPACCLKTFPGDPLCANPCDDERDGNGDGVGDADDPFCAPGGFVPIGCRDNNDNDTDGTLDEGDLGCWVNGCFDGVDNDSNGCIDGADGRCGGTEVGLCMDGIDNDCDGRTDEADSDCGSCINETDDDLDGLTDGNDPDCVPHGEDGCQNGLDDDMDGGIDEADDDCYGGALAPAGSCWDGLDNDDDGWTDCDDANCCSRDPACSGTTIRCP